MFCTIYQFIAGNLMESVTFILVLATFTYVLLSYRQLRLSNRREVNDRMPIVVIRDVSQIDVTFRDLVLSNIGYGPAIHVSGNLSSKEEKHVDEIVFSDDIVGLKDKLRFRFPRHGCTDIANISGELSYNDVYGNSFITSFKNGVPKFVRLNKKRAKIKLKYFEGRSKDKGENKKLPNTQPTTEEHGD